MKKPKTYNDYLKNNDAHQDSIMRKYGAPPSAKPPMERDFMPAPSDRQYRTAAFLKRRTLEPWPKSGRRYP